MTSEQDTAADIRISNAAGESIIVPAGTGASFAVAGAPPPPPPPPPDPIFEEIVGPCIDAQIARGGFGRNNDKAEFDIILNELGGGGNLWTAPYAFETAPGHGWISGDRAGYKAAYMFLYAPTDEGHKIVGRVTFLGGYAGGISTQINDKYMAEIQQTQISFHGKCGYIQGAFGSPDDVLTQAQAMDLPGDLPPFTPDFRPVIHFLDSDNNIVEDRSYTGTVAGEGVTFAEVERIVDPFDQPDGLGVMGRVYERVTVAAYKNGIPAVGVYYDILDPAYSFNRS